MSDLTDRIWRAIAGYEEGAWVPESHVTIEHIVLLKEAHDALQIIDQEPLAGVIAMQMAHAKTWQKSDERTWIDGLKEEVYELLDTLDGLHAGPAEHELRQIASIAINWLRYRLAAAQEQQDVNRPE